MSCDLYSLSSPPSLLSQEDELFFSSTGCLPNSLKTQVFAAWVGIFLAQLFVTVPFTVREWMLFGPSQAAGVLILVSFNILVFLLVELGFLFHIGLAWNVVVIGVAFTFLLYSASTILYSWYRAVVSIHLIRATTTKGELLKVLKRCFIVFILAIFVVLFALWGAGLISFYINHQIDVFNHLIAGGFVLLSLSCLLLSVLHMFVGRKLIGIFNLQMNQNPDQLIYQPERIRNRVNIYCIVQATLFFSATVVFLVIAVWGFVITTASPEDFGTFFYLYHFVINFFILFECNAVMVVIVSQERHATFTTNSHETLKKSTTPSSHRESVSSSLSNMRRGSIEDSPIPGVGGTIAYHSRVFLPPIDESDPEVKLDTFLNSLSSVTQPPIPTSPDGLKSPLFELMTIGEDKALMRRPSRADLKA